MPTNFKFVVDRVNAGWPWLLQWNTHEACGEFLQRVCNEPECKAERVGLLSKSPSENGITFENGVRTSHDVIAWPNGERTDVIQSAGGHPAPGGPAWGVIPPDQWRPSNQWTDISSWPIFDSHTPHDVTEKDCTIGFSWFCLQTALAEWPDEAKANMTWIINECNPSCFRVMLAVEGQSHMTGGNPDVWRDAGVFLNEDWDNRYKKMLDLVGGLGKQVHATIYGGRNQTPTESDRNRFHDRIIVASQGRWEAIRSWEMMNEFKVNSWTAPEVRAAGRDMRAKSPSGFRLSLSSPDAAHSGQPTNEDMEASFEELYGGSDHAGANECTIHTMRDGGKWSDPYSYNIFMPELPKINNEPPGPGSSAGGMYTTAADVEKDLNNTKGAGWAMYVAHSEWGVWNGHLPDCYYNSWREIRYVYDLPQMKEIAPILKGSSTSEPPPPPKPTDRLMSEEELLPSQQLVSPGKTCQALYDKDGNFVLYTSEGQPVWASQTAGTTPGAVKMNPDGNLVLYDAEGTPHWASHTDGNPGAMVQLQDDQTLVVYANPAGPQAGTPLWSSKG